MRGRAVMPERYATLKTGAAAAVLFAANAVICRRLFLTEYLSQLGAGDGPFVAMARYTMENSRDLSWWPLWFCGMPHQNVYGPLLYAFVAVVAAALRISPALALHAVGALFYCLGPVTLFWMAYRYSGSRTWAFCAGVLYSVLSPAALLVPAIRADIGGALHLRRLYNLVVYGEYPHVAVLTVIPLGLLMLETAVRSRKPAHLVWSAVLLAAVVTTSVTGSVGLAMVLLAWLISSWGRRFRLPWTGDSPVPRMARMPQMALAALLACGLALPWIPPSTVCLIVANSQFSQGVPFPFTARHLLYFALIAGGAALLRMALSKTPELLRFGLMLAFLSGSVMLPAAWTGIAILPQPLRFQLEFEIGCCLAGGFVLQQFLRIRPALPAVILAAAAVLLVIHNARHAAAFIRPIDMPHTTEYQSAVWFNTHMHGRRVFAPGSVSFWMNAFTDTPQLGGCCDQGVPNWEQRVALYTIYTGQNAGARDGEVALLWLQAYGVHAVEVSGPGGGEWYKPYWNPHKFDGLLPVLWRNGGDIIYEVPQRSDSLAHVIREPQVVSRAPRDGLDLAPLQPYVAAIQDPHLPLARMSWTGRGRATISADLAPGDLLSVQVSHHPGWRATANGARCPIASDGLGLMVLRPGCTGRCTIDLRYDGGAEMRIATAVQILTAAVCVGLLAISIRRKPGGVVAA